MAAGPTEFRLIPAVIPLIPIFLQDPPSKLESLSEF